MIEYMEETLIQTGLSPLQSKAYLYLLDEGASSPPAIAAALGLTRSNAYKVLDRLTDIGLVRRDKADKKLVYQAEDPTALTGLVGEAHNHAIAVEHAAKTAMQVLHDRYAQRAAPLTTETRTGVASVVSLYEQQAQHKQPIYYVRSPLDITYMGFETMHRLRILPADLGSRRYGITPDDTSAPVNPKIDKRTNLRRTWVASDEYRSPVEWSASGDELTIYVFDKETYALNIKSRVVAEAFRELWKLLDKSLRLRPDYSDLPKKAKRAI